jgi:hypothetical protein
MPFNAAQVHDVEFGVALRRGEERCYRVPIAQEVAALLVDMLRSTLASMDALGQAEEIDYGEEYGSRVFVRCPFTDPTVALVVELFTAIDLTERAAALHDATQIDYYFARFVDNAGTKCMGVKTPAQFKASFGKKLVQLLGDELHIVSDRIFKLDNEFDFVVFDDHVAILSPKQFIRVAEVDQVLAAIAPAHVTEVATALTVVDFEPIRDYIVRHNRAHKLLSSIRKRQGLAQISHEELSGACVLNHIHMTEQGAS